VLPDKTVYLWKNQATNCNCKWQFLSKRSTFNLDCTIHL